MHHPGYGLLLRLQKYDIVIQYKPGKSMMLADHLSCNLNPEASKVPTIPDLNLEVSALELNASPSKLSVSDKSLNMTLKC